VQGCPGTRVGWGNRGPPCFHHILFYSTRKRRCFWFSRALNSSHAHHQLTGALPPYIGSFRCPKILLSPH
jgi:hypothetical protein